MNKDIKLILESLLDDISSDIVSTISDDYEQLDKMLIDKIKSLPNNRTHINFYNDENNINLLTYFYDDIEKVVNIINRDDISKHDFRITNINNKLTIEIFGKHIGIPEFIINFNHKKISSIDIFSDFYINILLSLLKEIECKQINFICNKNKFILNINEYNNVNILLEKNIKFYNLVSEVPLYYTEIKPNKVQFTPIIYRYAKVSDDKIEEVLSIFYKNGVTKFKKDIYNSSFNLEKIIKQFCIDNNCEYVESNSNKIDTIRMHMNELLYNDKLNVNNEQTVSYDIKKQSTGKDQKYGKYTDYQVKIECYNKQNKYGYIILTYRYYNSSLLQLINTEEMPYN